MVERNLFEIDYWLSLRLNTRVRNSLGNLNCDLWCEDALKQIPPDLFTEVVVDLGDIQIDQYATSRLFHHWLERITNNGEVYIADGTAGQFDQQYPEGYYGLLKDAPRKLKNVYEKGINTSTTRSKAESKKAQVHNAI